jgi:hypothetical protein
VKAEPPAAAGQDGEDRVSRQTVVSAETAGLGNRLKSWASAMRLSGDARVHWAVTPNMPARFSQLFANDCAVEAIPQDARVYSSWRLVVLPQDEAHLPVGFATVGAGAHPLIRAAGKAWWSLRGRPTDRYRYMVFPKTHSRRSTRADARHLDLEYGRIPQYFREVYVPLFRRIAVLPDIARSVEKFSADAGLDAATIGVQIRTWRDDPRRHRKYHRPASHRLLRLMDGVPPEQRFLVVSDDDAIVAWLAKRYGAARIMHYPRETPRAESWQSAAGVVEDLIDMLLLARTRRLFASYLSTFSEAAWWLGGASAEVSVF